MASLYFDANRGFCLNHDVDLERHHHNPLRRLSRSNNKTIRTNGFDLLPLDEDESGSSNNDTDGYLSPGLGTGRKDSTVSDTSGTSESLGKSKKKSKEDRKEKRRQKKHNSYMKKLNKLSDDIKHKSLLDTFKNEEEEYNPYYTKHQLMTSYSKILQLFNRNNKEDFKLFQFNSIAFYKTDLDYLLPEEWLNDNNISFIYEWLIKTFVNPNPFNFEVQLLFPSLVQLLLHSSMEGNLEEMLPMKELMKLKFIFMPFNQLEEDEVNLEKANNGDHWILCLLCRINNKLYIYDSMAFEDETDERQDHLLEQLVDRLQSCKSLFKNNSKIEIVKMTCDQQDNSDDCGVHVIMNTCILIKRLFYGDKSDEDAVDDETNSSNDNDNDDDAFNPSDYKVNLDLSELKLNALDARLYMMTLIHKLSQEEVEKIED